MRADFHERFAQALREPAQAVPEEIAGDCVIPAALRFDVYRNNVRMSLIDALADGYPVVLRLVGDEFFHGMAGVYASREWPQSPVMLEYGEGFADFIAGFEPAATVPYLADIARLEWAWHCAYHAADAPVLDPARLAHEQDVERLVFELHPSVHRVCSDWPIVSIWEANAPASDPRESKIEYTAEAALLARPYRQVHVMRLPPGAPDFIDALSQGRPLAEAARHAACAQAGFDLSRNLQGLLDSGVFSGYRIQATTHGATQQ